MGMNVSSVGPSPISVQPTADTKRAALQAMILKKSLENQQSQADAMSREAEGKGAQIDIRV
jgi:hypothetical protein